MSDKPTNYTELTHQVVHEASEPLPFAEIVRRVEAIMPITTKNPKATIRNAITNSHLIVGTGDGRYDWKPRMLTGAVLRLPLTETELTAGQLAYPDEVRDALYPAFLANQRNRDLGPAIAVLPDGVETTLALEHAAIGAWGTTMTPELRSWLVAEKAIAGDDLLLTVIDGDGRRYALELQHGPERDEAAIAERNVAATEVALEATGKGDRPRPIWDVTSRILAQRFYHHPIPPDPLETLLAFDGFGMIIGDRDVLAGLEELPAPVTRSLEMMGLSIPADLLATDDPEPDDLPPEYEPGPNRRPRPSAAAARGLAPTVVLRVTYLEGREVWRDIEIVADQNLEDLHLAIQAAFGWDDDHLYSFFMSGRPYDDRTEVGCPWSDADHFTYLVTIESLRLKPGRHFLYLFDYGDDHTFDVEVLAHGTSVMGTSYPRQVGSKGRAPRQYR